MDIKKKMENQLNLFKLVVKSSNPNITILDNIGNSMYDYGVIKKQFSISFLNDNAYHSNIQITKRDNSTFVTAPIFNQWNVLSGLIIVEIDYNIATLYLWCLLVEMLTVIVYHEKYSFSLIGSGKEQKIFTKREKEVVDLLTLGYADNKISETLYISLPTVRKHVQAVFSKCKVNSRLELVSKLIKNEGDLNEEN